MSDIYSEKPWLKNYDKNVPPTLEYEEKTFAEKFREIVEKYPGQDRPHLHGQEDHLPRDRPVSPTSWPPSSSSSGLKPDDVVGLYMPNIPAQLHQRRRRAEGGGVSTGLSPLLTPDEMEHQINDSERQDDHHRRPPLREDRGSGGQDRLLHRDRHRDRRFPARDQEKRQGCSAKAADQEDPRPPARRCTPLKGKTVIRFMDAIKGMPKRPRRGQAEHGRHSSS